MPILILASLQPVVILSPALTVYGAQIGIQCILSLAKKFMWVNSGCLDFTQDCSIHVFFFFVPFNKSMALAHLSLIIKLLSNSSMDLVHALVPELFAVGGMGFQHLSIAQPQ